MGTEKKNNRQNLFNRNGLLEKNCGVSQIKRLRKKEVRIKVQKNVVKYIEKRWILYEYVKKTNEKKDSAL